MQKHTSQKNGVSLSWFITIVVMVCWVFFVYIPGDPPIMQRKVGVQIPATESEVVAIQYYDTRVPGRVKVWTATPDGILLRMQVWYEVSKVPSHVDPGSQTEHRLSDPAVYRTHVQDGRVYQVHTFGVGEIVKDLAEFRQLRYDERRQGAWNPLKRFRRDLPTL